LQDSLQEGLDQTPSQCWKGIIPQLFSRLNHPVKVVRNRISDLLCRIASDFPNLVIFPAVVGSVASETVKVSKMVGSKEDRVDQLDDDEEDELGDDHDQTPEIMQSAHEKIVHVMASTIPESVDHVKILVSELQRTSILCV
jgi:PI-3-kinase-related kinase SMG-1